MKSIINKHILLVLLLIFPQFKAAYAVLDTVKIYNNFFSPDTIDIMQGTTIVWILMEGFHTTTSGKDCSPNSQWNSGVLTDPGETFSFTFDTAGLFPYFCIPHCGGGMRGLVKVLKSVSHTVEIHNLFFLPDTLSIKLGDTVVWKLKEGFHTTTSGIPCNPDGIWTSKLLMTVGETFSHVFNAGGTYPYFCIPHCDQSMRGFIQVEGSVRTTSERIIDGIESFQIYPNPFSNKTVIEYEILKHSEVTVKVYDLLGNEVIALVNKSQSAGLHRVEVNAADLGFSNGVFFYRIRAGDYHKEGKMILVR